MNTTSTIFPNIGNRHRKCDEQVNDSPSKISSGISTSASAIDKQASTSLLNKPLSELRHHLETPYAFSLTYG
jgi:hypothetical protein